MPFGKNDLDPTRTIHPGPPKTTQCFVRGCQHVLRTPTNGSAGDVCPDHGIRCHASGTSRTYSYADVRRNFIIDADLLATRIVGHPAKHESIRLQYENSEDALTWNVLRSLQQAGLLHRAANLVCGGDSTAEPILYLWGIYLTGDTFEPWRFLGEARTRFETKLPVTRPQTEPDIALHLPGAYLILIEAKFTSENPFYANGPRRDSKSLTKVELADIYHDAAQTYLNIEKARAAERIHYQLWRNMVFAEWMARLDRQSTPAFLGSLTRQGYEAESCAEFSGLVNQQYQNRFRHISWEGLLAACQVDSTVLRNLDEYMQNKTARLVPAFELPNGALPAADNPNG